MAVWEGKKYKLEKSDNFDEYMKQLGVGMVLRKMGNSVTPTCYLQKVGDEYEFHTTSTFKSSVIKFKPGVEFEEETLDGRKVMATITFDGDNKLVQTQKGDKPSVITRVFTDTELITTMTLGDLVATRSYKVC